MSSSALGRAKRRAEIEHAYEIQAKAGAWGALKYGLFGAGVITFAHHTFPKFRRQTLAFKGFLTMGWICFGLITGAESALLAHEAEQRRVESRLRKEARIDLAKRGVVGTETEIAKWMDEKRAVMGREGSGVGHVAAPVVAAIHAQESPSPAVGTEVRGESAPGTS